MALPYFFTGEIKIPVTQFVLNEDTSRHVVQVLRMQKGQHLQLTDGRGNLFIAEITDNNKKQCTVQILSNTYKAPSPKRVTIAVSLVKNAHRFEWFLEKATEVGVSEIVPMLCARTEKQHFRFERMNSILISAMLQSQQTWLPVLHEPTKFSAIVKRTFNGQRLIAHCREDEQRVQLYDYQPHSSTLVLIGPEGDFTIDEIDLALQNNFSAVALGNTRLRTETAGVVAAAFLCIKS